MNQACATGVDSTGKEGHSDGFLMSDALEGADEVGSFEVLLK